MIYAFFKINDVQGTARSMNELLNIVLLARMKGARNGLFFNVFFMMHTSAMVPPCGPAGTSRAFRQRIAGTLVGQEHVPTETSRPPVHWPTPLWSFAKFRGRPSFATPLFGFGAHGARPHIHPAVTVGGSYWHSVCDGFHVLLVLGQYFRIVVIMKLRILATIAIDPLFEILRTIVAINSCTSPRSHFGTSSVPPPTTMGADPASAFFFWR